MKSAYLSLDIYNRAMYQEKKKEMREKKERKLFDIYIFLIPVIYSYHRRRWIFLYDLINYLFLSSFFLVLFSFKMTNLRMFLTRHLQIVVERSSSTFVFLLILSENLKSFVWEMPKWISWPCRCVRLSCNTYHFLCAGKSFYGSRNRLTSMPYSFSSRYRYR